MGCCLTREDKAEDIGKPLACEEFTPRGQRVEKELESAQQAVEDAAAATPRSGGFVTKATTEFTTDHVAETESEKPDSAAMATVQQAIDDAAREAAATRSGSLVRKATTDVDEPCEHIIDLRQFQQPGADAVESVREAAQPGADNNDAVREAAAKPTTVVTTAAAHDAEADDNHWYQYYDEEGHAWDYSWNAWQQLQVEQRTKKNLVHIDSPEFSLCGKSGFSMRYWPNWDVLQDLACLRLLGPEGVFATCNLGIGEDLAVEVQFNTKLGSHPASEAWYFKSPDPSDLEEVWTEVVDGVAMRRRSSWVTSKASTHEPIRKVSMS